MAIEKLTSKQIESAQTQIKDSAKSVTQTVKQETEDLAKKTKQQLLEAKQKLVSIPEKALDNIFTATKKLMKIVNGWTDPSEADVTSIIKDITSLLTPAIGMLGSLPIPTIPGLTSIAALLSSISSMVQSDDDDDASSDSSSLDDESIDDLDYDESEDTELDDILGDDEETGNEQEIDEADLNSQLSFDDATDVQDASSSTSIVDSVQSSVSDAVDSVTSGVSNVVNSVTDTVNSVVDSITGTATNIVDSVTGAVTDTVDSVVNSVTDTVSNAVDSATSTVKSAVSSATGTASAASETAVTQTTELPQIPPKLMENLEDLLAAVQSMCTTLPMALITSQFQMIFQILNTPVMPGPTPIISMIGAPPALLIANYIAAMPAATKVVTELPGKMKTAMQATVRQQLKQMTKNNFPDVPKSITEIKILPKIPSAEATTSNLLSKITGMATDAVQQTVDNATNLVTNTVNQVVGTATDAVTGVVDTATGLVSDTVDTITSPVNSVLSE